MSKDLNDLLEEAFEGATGPDPDMERLLQSAFNGTPRSEASEGVSGFLKRASQRAEANIAEQPDALLAAVNLIKSKAANRKLSARPAYDAIHAGVLAAGGLYQRATSPFFNAAIELQGAEAGPDAENVGVAEAFKQGVTGERLSGLGDVLRGAGVPDTPAAVAGLVGESVIDPVAMGVGLVRQAALQASRRAGLKVAKAEKLFSTEMFLRKNPKIAEHLIDTKYEGFTKSNMRHGGKPQQELAKEILEAEKAAHRLATDTYNQALPNARGVKIPQTASEEAASIMSTQLGKPGEDFELIDQILKQRIDRQTKYLPPERTTSSTTVTKLREATRYTKAGEVTDITEGFKTTTPTGSAGRALTTREGEALKQVTETTKKETLKAGKLKSVERTIEDVLTDVQSGTTVSAEDWIAVNRRLKDLSRDNVLASRMTEGIDEILSKHVKGLDTARYRWRMYNQIRNARKDLIGDLSKSGSPQNYDNLSRYFDDANIEDQVSKLDEGLSSIGFNVSGVSEKEFPQFARRIKDIAASQAFKDISPKLTALTYTGSAIASLAAFKFGGLPEAAAVLGLGGLIGLESTPRTSAILGKLIFSNRALIRNTPLRKAVEASSYATGRAVNEGASRELTGRE